jgi:hypothetical protein
MLKNIIVSLCICTLFTGCFSKFTLHQRYPYEGVYKHDVEITINGEKIDRSKDKERVWIMSDSTLTYVLDQTKQSMTK